MNAMQRDHQNDISTMLALSGVDRIARETQLADAYNNYLMNKNNPSIAQVDWIYNKIIDPLDLADSRYIDSSEYIRVLGERGTHVSVPDTMKLYLREMWSRPSRLPTKPFWVWFFDKYVMPEMDQLQQVNSTKPTNGLGFGGGLLTGAVLGGLAARSQQPNVVVVQQQPSSSSSPPSNTNSGATRVDKIKKISNHLNSDQVPVETKSKSVDTLGGALLLGLGAATLGGLVGYSIARRPQVIYVERTPAFLRADGMYSTYDGTIYNPSDKGQANIKYVPYIHMKPVEGWSETWDKFKSKFTGKKSDKKDKKKEKKDKKEKAKDNKEKESRWLWKKLKELRGGDKAKKTSTKEVSSHQLMSGEEKVISLGPMTEEEKLLLNKELEIKLVQMKSTLDALKRVESSMAGSSSSGNGATDHTYKSVANNQTGYGKVDDKEEDKFVIVPVRVTTTKVKHIHSRSNSFYDEEREGTTRPKRVSSNGTIRTTASMAKIGKMSLNEYSLNYKDAQEDDSILINNNNKGIRSVSSNINNEERGNDTATAPSFLAVGALNPTLVASNIPERNVVLASRMGLMRLRRQLGRAHLGVDQYVMDFERVHLQNVLLAMAHDGRYLRKLGRLNKSGYPIMYTIQRALAARGSEVPVEWWKNPFLQRAVLKEHGMRFTDGSGSSNGVRLKSDESSPQTSLAFLYQNKKKVVMKLLDEVKYSKLEPSTLFLIGREGMRPVNLVPSLPKMPVIGNITFQPNETEGSPLQVESLWIMHPGSFKVQQSRMVTPVMHDDFFINGTIPLTFKMNLQVLFIDVFTSKGSAEHIDILNVRMSSALVKTLNRSKLSTRGEEGDTVVYTMSIPHRKLIKGNSQTAEHLKKSSTKLHLYVMFRFIDNVLETVATNLVQYHWTSVRQETALPQPTTTVSPSPSSEQAQPLMQPVASGMNKSNGGPKITMVTVPPNSKLLPFSYYRQVKSLQSLSDHMDAYKVDDVTMPQFNTVGQSQVDYDGIINIKQAGSFLGDLKRKISSAFSVGFTRQLLKASKPIDLIDSLDGEGLAHTFRSEMENRGLAELGMDTVDVEGLIRLADKCATGQQLSKTMDPVLQLKRGIVAKVSMAKMDSLARSILDFNTLKNVSVNIYSPDKMSGLDSYRILEIPADAHSTLHIGDFFSKFREKQSLDQKYRKSVVLNIQIGSDDITHGKGSDKKQSGGDVGYVRKMLAGCPRTIPFTFNTSTADQKIAVLDTTQYHTHYGVVYPSVANPFKSNKSQKYPAIFMVEAVPDSTGDKLARIGRLFIIFKVANNVNDVVDDDA